MASVQNLEVVVEVDIAGALADLTKLQEKLGDVAEDINKLDARGAEGIDIKTDVEGLDSDLAAASAKLEAWERANDLDIDADVSRLGGAGQAGAFTAMLRMHGGRGGISRGFERVNDMMDNLTDSTSRFDIRMSDIHNLLATLVPLLLVFIGAIPAAATALVTLAAAALAAAAAFAVIAGLGALGAAGVRGGMPSMEDFTQFWDDIRDSFFEAFAPLADRLGPVFMNALDGLEMFFQSIADEGDALMQLVDDARAFGRWATEFIPRMLRGLAGLVEAMAPIIGLLGEFLTENIISIIEDFVQHTMDAMPAVMALAGALMEALPAIVQISIGFARVSTAIVQLIGVMWSLFTVFGLLNEEAIGVAIASLLTLLTVVALTNKLLAVFSGTIIGRVVGAVAIWAAENVFAATSSLFLAKATLIATGAVLAFLTVISLGVLFALGGAAAAAASDFFGLADSINAATGAMSDFNRVSGKGDGRNPYGGGGAPPPGSGGGGGGAAGAVTVNMERTGDKSQDDSDGSRLEWRMGRTTGKRP